MELLQKNPFTTLKANDLDDCGINEQWVDIEGKGFVDLFSPTSLISQYIIGGKGSGKTHLMRYFSYRSQCLRHTGDILKGIERDGFFGVYFQASGLNGSRFDCLPQNEEIKSAAFEYSLELWCAGLVLEALIYLHENDCSVLGSEKDFCDDVLSLLNICNSKNFKVETLSGLKEVVVGLSKEVDLEVNNAYFKKDIELNILVNRGALIFGVPALLKKHSKAFKDVTFLYLVDELENVSESQQKYFNTLLREKKLPVSLRLGVRAHGIKTYATLGSGEENREGHEFEKIRMDNVFNDPKQYESFAFDLILNRLDKAGFVSKDIYDNQDGGRAFLTEMFECPNFEVIVNNAKVNKGSGLSPVLSAFNSRLLSKLSKEDALSISRNLSFPESSIIELSAIHLLSQKWARGTLGIKDLIDLSKAVKYEIVKFSGGDNKSSPLARKIKYYKNNYTASSLRASVGNNLDEYLGFDQLLLMTKGFPRHILTLLRNIYKIEVFHGRAPFSNAEKISLKSQRLALKESSDWFHDDCVTEGELGGGVAVALSRLCEILRIEMYADKPVECSASGFSVDRSSINEKARRVLDWAVLTKVLVKSSSDRQEKNSQKIISSYYLNGMLCPKWGLSVNRRGSLSLSSGDFNSIFDPDLGSDFERFKSRFYSSRHVPFEVVEESCVGYEDVSGKSKQLGLDL